MLKTIWTVLNEIEQVLMKINEKDVDGLVKSISHSGKIVTIGAGRMGLAARSFAMRLAHLGMNAYNLGDSNVPSIGKSDLLIVVSGSGETKTILDLVNIAKKHQATIALITGNRDSSMGKLSDIILDIFPQSKTKVNGFKSIQPMTTLNEQCAFIFFDTLVLRLMNKLNITHDDMWKRHSVLE